MRRALRFGVYPASVAAVLFGTHHLVRAGVHPAIVLGVGGLVFVVFLAFLERVAPFEPTWAEARNDVRTDIAHGVLTWSLMPALLEPWLVAGLGALAAHLSNHGALWPATILPEPLGWLELPTQVVLAALVSEFGTYGLHRAMHRVPWLWRLHRVHHSPSRLYWLNGARFHPLDLALSLVVQLSPLVLLGTPSHVILLFTAWTSMNAFFRHSNVHVSLGWLNYVVSMAEVHRVHHEPSRRAYNYGALLSVWDLVFRTFRFPAEPVRAVGLPETDRVSPTYLGQLWGPFQH